MTKTFIQTKEFSVNWDELGFTDEDLRKLEFELLKNPKSGAVISGTGKLRKLRFPFLNKGKSGSVRICYVDFVAQGIICLITVYSKSEKENLTKRECNNIKKSIELLESSLSEEEVKK